MNSGSTIKMISQVHLAAQYLAAAGISILEKEADDSHTSLLFDGESGSLYSRNLNQKGDQLSFNYDNFSLVWQSTINPGSIPLDGENHSTVLEWIKNKIEQAGIKEAYRYEFHYSLPYDIDDAFNFELIDESAISFQKELRALAQLSIEAFLKRQGFNAEVRVWPHHFDTGTYFVVDEGGNFAIGLGLAIPDVLCDEFYFYISGYRNNAGIDPKYFESLKLGEWISNGYKGAILPASEANEHTIHEFFDAALGILSASVQDN